MGHPIPYQPEDQTLGGLLKSRGIGYILLQESEEKLPDSEPRMNMVKCNSIAPKKEWKGYSPLEMEQWACFGQPAIAKMVNFILLWTYLKLMQHFLVVAHLYGLIL